MSEKKLPRLGKIQLDLLSRLEIKTWSPGCGWTWNTRGGTVRLLDSLVRRGVAVEVWGRYSITPLGVKVLKSLGKSKAQCAARLEAYRAKRKEELEGLRKVELLERWEHRTLELSVAEVQRIYEWWLRPGGAEDDELSARMTELIERPAPC